MVLRFNFYDAMSKYLAMIFFTTQKALEYKGGANLVWSALFSFVLTIAESIWSVEFYGIQYSFLILALLIVMLVFLTDSLAYRKENRGKPYWITDNRVWVTVYKVISIWLILWLSEEIHNAVLTKKEDVESDFWEPIYGSALTTISIVRTVVFTLIVGREYLLLGENIYRLLGVKYYCFTIFEKILNLIELKFIKKIEKNC